MILPSKELLSAVLNEEITNVSCRNDIIKASRNYFDLYKLTHLMKEWVLKQDKVTDIDVYINDAKKEVQIVGEFGCSIVSSDGDTEFEAVTKACEWILKEIKC